MAGRRRKCTTDLCNEFVATKRRCLAVSRRLDYPLRTPRGGQRPVTVDRFPLPSNPGIDGGRIPAYRHLLAVGLYGFAAQVVREHHHIAVALYLGTDHLVSRDLDLPRDWQIIIRHGREAIHPVFGHGVEVRFFRGVGFEESLGIPLAPSVKRSPFEPDNFIRLPGVSRC